MRKDIQDALLSVREVAVFAWSLLELLLTRILPLAGFLAGHLLLQFGNLVASAVISTAAGRRAAEPQAENSYDVKASEEVIEQENIIVQAEEVIEQENDVQEGIGDLDQNDLGSLQSKSSDKFQEGIGDHDQNDLGILQSKISSDKLEESQGIFIGEGISLTHEEDADVAMPAAAVEHVHVAESVASDGQMSDLRAADGAAANDQSVASDGQMDNLRTAADAAANEAGGNVGDVVGEEQQQVSAKAGEGNAGRMPSADVQTSEEATKRTEGEMMMRKSRRRMRVLPPSLSQIKRTLMQRSRRASASPSPISKKKLNNYNISPRSRKLASPAIKSSPSYDNFMGKFTKHFLLDRA